MPGRDRNGQFGPRACSGLAQRRKRGNSGAMMRRSNIAILFLAWLAAPLALLTLAAPLLAPRWLAFDMLSHFAVHGGLYLAVLLSASLFRRHFVRLFIAGGLVAAAGAFGLPFLWQAALPGGAAPGGGTKVLSFNLHGWANTDLASIEALLRHERADLVLLLEFTRSQKPLLRRLRAIYPHQADCTGHSLCRLALLSRYPLSDVHLTPRDYDRHSPALANAVVALPSGPVRFLGTHVTRPTDPHGQRAHLGHVARLAAGEARLPVIAAGDFNAVPWSFLIREFQQKSGLRCFNRFSPTWPMQPIGLAQFPIDQICAGKPFTRGAFRALPATGSDHRPVAAILNR